MAFSKKYDYFGSLVKMADFSCKAGEYLKRAFADFSKEKLPELLEKMHEIEHGGDNLRHEMVAQLADEFITPIDREDILEMSEIIDNITDKTEDVLKRVYMHDVDSIRPEAMAMAELICECINSVRAALEEFPNYKKSKKLNSLIIEINRLEEEGDYKYTDAIHAVLSEKGIDPLEAYAWSTIYDFMEDVYDACEDAADVMEDVIMKNS
jgi:predicted phosphate transport protein (TIGR00153 family)